MKLLNADIFLAKGPLEKLIEKELPVKVSFALAKLANKLSEAYATIEQVRTGLIQRYGEPNPENPEQSSVLPEHAGYPKFVEEFNELMEQSVEVVIDVVTLPEMVDGVALTIEPSTLMALEKFVTVE